MPRTERCSASSKQLWGALPATLVRDAERRITRFQVGSEAMDYLYDEDGRVRKTGGIGPVAANRLYVDCEYESDLLGLKHQKHMFVGDQRIAITERPGIGNTAAGAIGEPVLFVHSDYRESAVLVTRSDGSVAQRAFIRPWGEAVVVDGAGSPLAPQSRVTSYLLAGTELDGESNFYSMGARYLDPVVGRFLSQDPELVGASAGVSFGRIGESPADGNAYAYAVNRPTIFGDPRGRYVSPLDVVDYASLSISAYDFYNEPSWTNFFVLSGDVIGAAIPVIPTGFGLLRHADDVVDAGRGVASAGNIANKINHILRPGKNLEGLVRASGGSAEAAYNAVQQAANQALRDGLLRPGANGVLPGGGAGAILNINGVNVQLIGGRVIDGVVHIGSFVGL